MTTTTSHLDRYDWYGPHQRWLRGEPGGVRAVLRRADLGGAVLRDAVLRGAVLRYADLSGAVLRRADLGGADLSGADLSGADLREADLGGAVLSDADLSLADLRGAAGIDAPAIPRIDAAILAAVRRDGCALDMSEWHACATTHCRAGWAIHLAGDAGYALEDRIGSSAAGALIYAASRPGVPVPDFYASNKEAMADIRRCAGVVA